MNKNLTVTLHKKWSFPLRISSVNATKSAAQFPTDLVTFTEEIPIENFIFCAVLQQMHVLKSTRKLFSVSP